MSTLGYVYLMSNPALKRSLYKIGLCSQQPKNRAESLSKSTSIPSNFVVEHYQKTVNIELSEKRIHLIMDKFRYSPNKEFFKIKKDLAKNIIDFIVKNTEMNYKPSNEFEKSNELIMATYSKRQSLSAMRILDMLMCSAQNNTHADGLFGFQKEFVSGFLSYTFVMESLKVTKIHAMNLLKEFAKKYYDLAYQLPNDNEFTNIFDYVTYYKGELGWRYNPKYRELFYNYTMPTNDY